MGLVPWVERSSAPADDAVRLRDAVEAVEQGFEQLAQAATVQPPEPKHTLATPTSTQKSLSDSTPNLTTDQVPSGTVAVSNPDTNATDFMQTPLVEFSFRGQRCTQLGNADAPLLILVEATSTQQNQYPFEAADAKIFEDMLRAIAWRRQDVCLGVLLPSSTPSLFTDHGGPCVSDLCQPHRDAVLIFRQTVPQTLVTDELMMPLQRNTMPAWQLPHPALLRLSPQRKRQAWNVLKAARARLS